MAQFLVVAANKDGRSVKVLIDADTAKTARSKAKAKGLTPLEVNQADAETIRQQEEGLVSQIKNPLGGIKAQELANAIKQFASLISSNVPLIEALSVLIEQLENKKLVQMLSTVMQTVKEGSTLGDAFEQFPKVFDKVFVNMIRAGESSGKLDTVLLRVAEFQEEQLKFKDKVMNAVLYPVILVVVALVMVIFIFTFVIPQMSAIFEGFGKELPLITQIMMATSEFFLDYGIYVGFGILGFMVLMERFFKTAVGKPKKDSLLLSMPLIGQLNTNIIMARVTKTLGTLLASGVNMLTSLEIAKNVANNTIYEDAMVQIKTMVSDGHSLAYSLRLSKKFPPIVIHMVGVGEKTGELEKMLATVAKSFEDQVDNSLTRITAAMSPIMIVFLAGIVAIIAFSVILPIMEMSKFS